jgi:hypothetical protein
VDPFGRTLPACRIARLVECRAVRVEWWPLQIRDWIADVHFAEHVLK